MENYEEDLLGHSGAAEGIREPYRLVPVYSNTGTDCQASRHTHHLNLTYSTAAKTIDADLKK